jgi:hypothetical protein
MELLRTEIRESPEGADRLRLAGEVHYDDPSLPNEWYWFDVPRAFSDALSTSGNPWLVALAPLAATLGEPLLVRLPSDPLLPDRLREVMRIWRSWYPTVSVVPVASGQEWEPPVGPRRHGAFFSGGVDSFFTALRPRNDATGDSNDATGRIDDLITVWGFDIPLARRDAIDALRGRFRAVADELGLGFVDVATNFRETQSARADWGWLAHGCALVATGLVLEGAYDTLSLAATGGDRDPHPWGSHARTDPLLGTSATTIITDGRAFTRTDKTRLLVRSPVALRELRVCWSSASHQNCGACNKCIRTMLILELLGGLDRCATFARTVTDLADVARIHCNESWDFREFRDIAALAVETGRPDIQHAAESAMRRSRRRAAPLAFARANRHTAVVGGGARLLERLLLRGTIT